MVQWLRPSASNVRGAGLTPVGGTKIWHASLYNPPQKIIITQEYFLRVPGTYKYLWVGGCYNHCHHYQCHHGDDDNDFLKGFIYLFIFSCKESSLVPLGIL